MFITTYNKANPNIKEIIKKQWPTLERSRATRKHTYNCMVTYRNSPLLKDMLVWAKNNPTPKDQLQGMQKTTNLQILQQYIQFRNSLKFIQ